MHFLVDHLLGIVRPINPLAWPAHVRHLRSSEGWTPPMMIIACMGVLAGINWGFGLLGANAFVRLFNYASLATWFAVASLATWSVLGDSTRNLVRFRCVAMSRPRWWFELSRSTWLIALVIGLSLPLAHLTAIAPAIRIAEAVFFVAPIGVGMFFVFATLGYLASVLMGRPRRGRAYECVDYFYAVFGGTFAVTAFVIWLPKVAPGVDGPLTVSACLVAASLMGVLALKIGERAKRRAGGETLSLLGTRE